MTDAEYADYERREAIDFARERFIANRDKPEPVIYDWIGNLIQDGHPEWSKEEIISVLDDAQNTTTGDPDQPVDEDLLPCPSAKDTGITVCKWGIPHVDGKRVQLELHFYQNPKRKRKTLIQRYRINGKPYYPKYFTIARAIAELQRDEPQQLTEKFCARCHNAFFLKPRGQKARFCSSNCRKRANEGRTIKD